MKHSSLTVFSLLLLIVILSSALLAQTQLEQKLKSLEGIVKVTQLEADSIYSEIYEIFIDQPVDHNDPGGDHLFRKFI